MSQPGQTRLSSFLDRDDVQTYVTEIKSLVRLVDAYRRGDYRDIDAGDVRKIVAGLVYLVMPVDVVPDFLGPVLGFVDDIVVLRWIIRTLRNEIQRFEAWERGEGRDVVILD